MKKKFIHLVILVTLSTLPVTLNSIELKAQQTNDFSYQLQNIQGRDFESLDGLWSTIIDPLEN